MPTSDSRISFLTDQLGGAGEVRMKKMFGEFGVYLDEVFIGVVCDDQLFLKVTPGGKCWSARGISRPPTPAPNLPSRSPKSGWKNEIGWWNWREPRLKGSKRSAPDARAFGGPNG